MRQDFPRNMPLAEQFQRKHGHCHTGRKHQHRPSGKVLDRRKAKTQRELREQINVHRVYKLRVEAYWRGELEEYPS